MVVHRLIGEMFNYYGGYNTKKSDSRPEKKPYKDYFTTAVN